MAKKLSLTDANWIREWHAAGGITQTLLSEVFGTSVGLISLIVNRKIWNTDFQAICQCKQCIKTRRAAYYVANREEIKARSARYYSANADLVLAYQKSYQKKNWEHVRTYSSAWRAENKDKKKASDSAWKKENPMALRVHNQNRRARKRANGGALSNGIYRALFAAQNGKCACGCKQPLGESFHLDHIMPISLGGTNTDDNVQLLRSSCNLQKGGKHPVTFMQERGFLL